jgi:ubiquitin C-terminal hydrolase
VREELLNFVKHGLLTMTEEQAKKENSDSVASLIRYIGVAQCDDFEKGQQVAKAASFHEFWMKYAFRAVQSGSLVLKLFGWDQINELVREAISTRPPVEEYEVVGAGTDYVNGRYVLTSRENDGSPRFTKMSQSDDVPTLTLYRCVMKGNKGRYWFITNLIKDADYYQHQSLSYQDNEPQGQGWVCVSYNNMQQVGRPPAPVVRRAGPPVLPEGASEAQYLFNTFPDWVLKNDLLGHVFRSSPHREIIARSSAMVALLAEADRLNTEHLSLIWKTAIQSHDADAVDEIFSLLVTTCAYLSEEMYSVVIGFALELVEPTSAGSNTAAGNSVENYSKAALFVEKFSRDPLHDVGKLSSASAAKLISLVWAVYKHPQFETLKSATTIQEFLTSCLSLPSGKQIAYQSIVDCLQRLPNPTADAHSTLSASPQSEVALNQMEQSASRIILALNFLFCKEICSSMSLTLEEEGVASRIIEELTRFIRRNRHRYLSKSVDPQWYGSELTHRFACLRQFYGLHASVKMSLEVADVLWQLVKDVPVETESLFSIFSQGAVSKGPFYALADYPQFIEIFKRYICSDNVDWATVGERAYECFEIYFRGLQSPGAIRMLQCSPKELPPFIGMDTLWNIVFNIQHGESQKSAVTYLIKSYEEMAVEDSNEHTNIVQRIFLQLKVLADSLNSAENGNRDMLNSRLVRCLEVLNTVVMKSRAAALPIHALQGCMQRIKVTVNYRRVTTIFNYNTQSNTLRTEKGSETSITLDTHPLHTIRQVKKKLARMLGLNNANVNNSVMMVNNINSSNQKIQLDGDLKQATDSDHIGDYGIGEGSTISAYSYATFGGAMRSNYNSYGNYNQGNNFDADSLNDANGDMDDSGTGLASIGATISSDTALFELLLELADTAKHPAIHKDVVNKIWGLLMLIPTQENFVNEVLSCAVDITSTTPQPDEACADRWKFLSTGSLARRTYLLQIVDHLMQPSSDSTIDSATTAEFAAQFLNFGGFTAVLNLFTTVNPAKMDDSSEEVAKVTLSVALHLLHHILFDRGVSCRDGSISNSRPTSVNSMYSSRHDSPSVIDVEEIQLMDKPTPNQSLNATDVSKVVMEPDPRLLAVLHTQSAQVIEKLLSVASTAANNSENSSEAVVVRNALMILTLLLRSSDAAVQMINNPVSKPLLLTVLRSSGSSTVREMAADFAIQVGKSQPVVFSWLLADFRELRIEDNLCADLCRALAILMNHMFLQASGRGLTDAPTFDWAAFAKFLVDRIYWFGEMSTNGNFMEHVFGGNVVILGHLHLLERLIRLNPEALATAHVNFKDVAVCLVNKYMFPLPQEDRDDFGPICATTTLKKAGFQVLSALIALKEEVFFFVLDSLSNLSSSASTKMRDEWGIQISNDVKRTDIPFAGLKNQGCTCYANSLLQQLFLVVPFREAVLRTPIRECHRHTVSHMTGEELVGNRIVVEWENLPLWRPAMVLSYDEVTSEHTIEYSDGDREQVTYVLEEGRYKRETGSVRIASPTEAGLLNLAATDRELGAYRVLEQLQRTFCFLKYSKRRYFDPRPLVEACKVLNLNFNVFQQNDASEFCDQLLDRVEIAMKGKHTGIDLWTSELLSNVFGGKTLTQKIPQQCELYETDKKTCGHWQSSRQESFLKIELIIRGKDNMHDSISELVAGELMDGDNKISCDVCLEKKATFRRTCFDILPNTMIIHLKRFDLDFTTFETVKLNSRLAFDSKINMLKYTKEGMEAEERRQAKEAAAQAANTEEGGNGSEIKYDVNSNDAVEPDPLDYEYQLQGVLVHSGIAQGGHYYSFAREPTTSSGGPSAAEKWYRFDDDDVTVFNPDQIPYQCFGGPQPSQHGSSSNNFDSEDRSANAFMLFYSKTRPTNLSANEATTAASTPSSSPTKGVKAPNPAEAVHSGQNVVGNPEAPIGARLVNGYQAFYKELRSWNLEHLLSRYVLDADLHVFVREIFESVIESQRALVGDNDSNSDAEQSFVERLEWYKAEESALIPLQLVQFGCSFLFDVVLKCRERSATKSWVSALKSLFARFPSCALWFLQTNMNRRCCIWFRDYLLSCTDALARNTYIQVLAAAVQAVATSIDAHVYANKGVLLQFEDLKHSELVQIALTEVNFDSGSEGNAAGSGDGDGGQNNNITIVVPQALLYLFTNELIAVVLHAAAHPKVADDIFNLIREVATVPCVGYTLLHKRAVTYLCAVVLPDCVPEHIKAEFERSNKKSDSTPLHASIFEALAALLGVPQLRKVQLISEVSQYEYELLPAAREAFTTIFTEVCPGNGMDALAIVEYKERIGVKVSLQQAKVSLSRFQTNTEGKLTLEGFLQYYCDLASYNPKDVWRVSSLLLLTQ